MVSSSGGVFFVTGAAKGGFAAIESGMLALRLVLLWCTKGLDSLVKLAGFLVGEFLPVPVDTVKLLA